MIKGKMIADRYEIIRALGEGGMADVYLAHDKILDRDVAIKILRGELSKDPVTLLRFQREASAVSKLHHHNIVEVYDVGEYEGRNYMVMEYVQGRTLKQLILQRGPLCIQEAVDIMIQLVSAIKNAHDNDIIHRDIKPQNVLIKDDGTVKITDFGIALASNAVQLTQSDSVLGSAHYIAPETTRGESSTPKIDIYALGIVFYEMLVGKVPFNGDNPVQIAMKHLKEDLPSVRKFNPTIPQSVENIIIKATAKNVNNRYQSADEMLKDLECCLDPAHQHDKPLVLETNEDKENVTKCFNPKLDRPKLTNDEDKEIDKKPKKKNRLKSILIQCLITIISVAIIIVIIYYSGLIDGFEPTKYVKVPNLSGKSEEQASEILKDAHLELDPQVNEEVTDNAKVGTIIKQHPQKGSEVKEDSKVNITISSNNYFVIENYVWQSIYNVENMLKDEGIIVEKEYQARSDVQEGIILAQEYLEPGMKVVPGSGKKIKFIVSTSPKFVMSNFVGSKIDNAKNTLEGMGARVSLVAMDPKDLNADEKKNLKKGVVVKQSVEPGVYYQQTGNSVVSLYYYK